MQINKVNNCPNFEARIKIQKHAFQNIAKDFSDSSSVSGNSGAILSSTTGESTIFPLDLIAGKGFSDKINNQFKKIGEHFYNIFHRNIQTTIIENPENLKEFSKQSTSALGGSSTISSGLGSYAGSIGSALDQSINYPFGFIYDKSVPEFLLKNAPESVNKSLDALANSAYNTLYNEQGLGNECASMSSTLTSGAGAMFQGLGSVNIIESSKKMKEVVSKKIPS